MIKKWFNNLVNWCNEKHGLIHLCILIVAIIAIIPFNIIDFGFANSYFQKVILVIRYNVQIPLYILIIVCIALFTYVVRIRKRYTVQKITTDFMIGTWHNDWTTKARTGTEDCVFTKDKKYFLKGVHTFNIENFKFDGVTGKISFTKVAVKPNDNRKLFDELQIKNNDLLEGKEDNFPIKYIRISH